MSAGWWQRIAELVRAVIGAPSYELYLAHMQAHHPESTPIGRGEFTLERLRNRYDKPGSRCC